MRDGKRKGRRLVQRYLCKSCGKSFFGIGLFAGRHCDTSIIMMRAPLRAAAKTSPREYGHLNMQNIIIDAYTIRRWSDCYLIHDVQASPEMRADMVHRWHVMRYFSR